MKAQAQIAAEQQKEAIRKAQKKKEDEEIDKLASQIDSLQTDDKLLAGLEELNKREKDDIDQKKKLPQQKVTPRGTSADKDREQGQGSAISKALEEKPNKGDNESNLGLIGVVAALVVAGGIIAYRSYAKK